MCGLWWQRALVFQYSCFFNHAGIIPLKVHSTLYGVSIVTTCTGIGTYSSTPVFLTMPVSFHLRYIFTSVRPPSTPHDILKVSLNKSQKKEHNRCSRFREKYYPHEPVWWQIMGQFSFSKKNKHKYEEKPFWVCMRVVTWYLYFLKVSNTF